MEIRGRLTGTEDEGQLRWSTSHPGALVRLHVCSLTCPNTLKVVRLRRPDDPAWVDNLKGASGLEELKRLEGECKEELDDEWPESIFHHV